MVILRNTIFLFISSLILFSCGSDDPSQISVTSNISGGLNITVNDTVSENTLLYRTFTTTNFNTDTLLEILRFPEDKVSDIQPKSIVYNISDGGKGNFSYIRQIRVFLTTIPGDTTPENIQENWMQIARLDTINPATTTISLTLVPEFISVKNLILNNDPESLFLTSIMETRKEFTSADTLNTDIITNYQISGKLD